MKRLYFSVFTLSIAALLSLAACGSSSDAAAGASASDQGSSVSAEASASQVAEAQASASAAVEASASAPAVEASAVQNQESSAAQESPATSTSASSSDLPAPASKASGPYAWLGLQDMPQCNYLDAYASYHYIQTYDAYAMSVSIEETEAVDGVNSYKGNANTRAYSVDGKILSINENSKIYMEEDMTSAIDAAKESLKQAQESGDNYFGRAFVGTGKASIPLYSDSGDAAEYEYYEYNYPSYEEYGTAMTERFYMKDGDVFAIYQKTSVGESEVEMTNVIKSMSSDIPAGTFDFPNLDGYTKYDL